MINRNNITLYRVITSAIVILPIVAMQTLPWSIFTSLLYVPLFSLLLAAIAKYIDSQLMKSVLLQESQALVANIPQLPTDNNFQSAVVKPTEKGQQQAA
ncbi:hypothetical protein [Thalassotalea sp. ND16A]|uniref:hypothetical protein n=1 Tax=Thalassotalea sp. ND16A TaxID=1535422 RepID=UPI000519EE5E|nr:hypothetical protein [Thalassotalea sp. ND16A]KGJ95812.1 hypothetical protein ND16A_1347 [Thalassotalea sp. ND16A]